jgi:hypothetical protein
MNMTLRSGAFALALVGGAALLATPSVAVEPDVDSAAGPELPAPRYSDPEFQFDDQAGAPLERDIEGTDSSIPDEYVIVKPGPAIVIEPE